MLVADEPTTDQGLVEIRDRGSAVPGAAPELRRLDVCLLEVSRLFRLEGHSTPIEPEHLAVLHDSRVEVVCVWPDDEPDAPAVDVFCKPGVTDAEGETAELALAHAGLVGVCCRAGRRYRFAGPVPCAQRPAVER